MSTEPEEEYQVEEIHGWRWSLAYGEGERLFNIKWKDYGVEDNTWEPQAHLNCPDILKRFRQQLPPEEKLNYRSDPKHLSGFERNAVFQGVQGADGPGGSDAHRPRSNDKFFVLIKFDDKNEPEEHAFDFFMKYRPEEAMQFLESRLIDKRAVTDDMVVDNFFF